MNNYFIEHLRDIRNTALTKARENYMRDVSRQLMTAIDRVSHAKEHLRDQARHLNSRVAYCFFIDLTDINSRYPNLDPPPMFYEDQQTILRALKQEFPGMDVALSTTENTITYTVSAEL
jgi:hypothetical protein